MQAERTQHSIPVLKIGLHGAETVVDGAASKAGSPENPGLVQIDFASDMGAKEEEAGQRLVFCHIRFGLVDDMRHRVLGKGGRGLIQVVIRVCLIRQHDAAFEKDIAIHCAVAHQHQALKARELAAQIAGEGGGAGGKMANA